MNFSDVILNNDKHFEVSLKQIYKSMAGGDQGPPQASPGGVGGVQDPVPPTPAASGGAVGSSSNSSAVLNSSAAVQVC